MTDDRSPSPSTEAAETSTIEHLRESLADTRSAAREAETRFHLLVHSVKDYAIFLLGPEGRVESWNEGAERNNGYRAHEIIGKHFSVFYTPEDIARNHPHNELEIAKREGRYEEEGWRVRKDGTRFWANVVITRLTDDQGALVGFAKVTRDLTERREAEEKLRQAMNELELRVEERTRELSESNRQLREAVQIRDEFLSIASHELRTPLTPLKLQVQGLVQSLKSGKFFETPPERAKRMAQTLDRSIARLSILVDGLLDVSRLNAGRFELSYETVDLVPLVQELVERYRSELITTGNAVTVRLPSVLTGEFDRMRIEQVVTNLLTNAMKYGKGQPIGIEMEAASGQAIIRVRDEGMGISTFDQKRIFERFERGSTDGTISGLGLGLYITRQIVQAHGGSIRVESREGHGSTFTVELPLRPAKVPVSD